VPLSEKRSCLTADNQTAQFEKQFPSEQGVRHYGIKLSQLLDGSRKLDGTVVNLEDLTVQRQANRALKKMKRKLGKIPRDNGLITDYALHRSLALQQYEVRRFR